MDIFVSVGTGLNQRQEAFVGAVEARLRTLGFNPCTIGRNTFSTEAPMSAIIELMDRCAGAVVIAVERYFFERGSERRGSDRECALGTASLPTSWNQIEAAMAYGRRLPLLVVVDEDLKCDGLLEKGNDWFVFVLPLEPAALNGAAFSGLLENWRAKVVKRSAQAEAKPAATSPALDQMSIAQLLGALKPAQLWASLVALAGVIAGAFALGAKLGG
jgi:hypothetical protein